MDANPFQPHLLTVVLGCLVSALSALAILLRDPGETSNRLAAALVGGAAWWGFCQVMWTAAPDAPTAYFWHHLAGPGWAFIGPLSLSVLIRHSHPPRWMAAGVPPAFAIGTGFALMQLTTSWMHGEPVRTSFGWGFEPGPGHTWFLVFTFACVIPAIAFALRRVRSDPSPAFRRQMRVVALGIAAPFVLAGLTSGFLPLLGIQLPRLGSLSFSLLGVVIAWSYYRYGFSALAPSHHAREILATLPDGLALLGLEGEVLSGNDRMGQLLGIEPSRLDGADVAGALSVPVLSPPRELREHECTLTALDGSEIAVSISTSLLRDKQSFPIGVVLVVRDLREIVELRSHLVTSGRLAAVGELAAGIAHEINNPIAFVRSNLAQLQEDWELLARQLPAGARPGADGLDLVDEGKELIAECIDGVERTVHIVRDVKGFARGGEEERELLDLRELLARVVRVANPQIPHGVQVVERFGEVPAVLGSAPALQQVFLNLVINSNQAIGDGGHIVVETRTEDGMAVVSVSDDGCGIAEQDCDRIFDPFFTTKPAGEGTGLGLAISFQILESHAAQVSVESEVGVGTTFQIRFPEAPLS